jgi:hypothetical protein
MTFSNREGTGANDSFASGTDSGLATIAVCDYM